MQHSWFLKQGQRRIIYGRIRPANFGVYANSSVYKRNPLDGFVNDSDEYHHQHSQFIDPEEYGNFAKKWIDEGVYALGGCCRTSTDHIKIIKKIVESL